MAISLHARPCFSCFPFIPASLSREGRSLSMFPFAPPAFHAPSQLCRSPLSPLIPRPLPYYTHSVLRHIPTAIVMKRPHQSPPQQHSSPAAFTSSFLPSPASRPFHRGRHPAASTSTRLSALPPASFLQSTPSNPSTFLAEMTEDFGYIAPTFEARLDVGALFSLLVMTVVVSLFWLRVATAITDREKREKLEKIQKEVRLKRLTGKMNAEDEEELRLAEEEQATPALGFGVGSFLRNFRLINEGKRQNGEEGNDGGNQDDK